MMQYQYASVQALKQLCTLAKEGSLNVGHAADAMPGLLLMLESGHITHEQVACKALNRIACLGPEAQAAMIRAGALHHLVTHMQPNEHYCHRQHLMRDDEGSIAEQAAKAVGKLASAARAIGITSWQQMSCLLWLPC